MLAEPAVIKTNFECIARFGRGTFRKQNLLFSEK